VAGGIGDATISPGPSDAEFLAMSPPPAPPQVLPFKPLRSTVSAAEWQARVDLAAGYRLCDLYGMSDMIFTHISARVPGERDHFLLNPHGTLFGAVTASSLLKVDLDGKVQYQPEGQYGLHRAGCVIDSALYRARPDINAAMHTHTIAGMAVSALKCGLLPLTQTGAALPLAPGLSRFQRAGARPRRARRARPRPRPDELPDPAQSRPADGGSDDGRSLHRHVRN
jgi:hypothetical protein